MIRPSRRRTSPGKSVELDFHRRLARVRDRNRRLTIAGAAALVAAVAVWLVGMPLEARAAVVVAVAGLAWLVPVPGGEAWALGWIARQSGLAYQTALELDDESDRYGFRTGVLQRARENLSGVEEPEHSAWWLPLLALALGALLLPSLPLLGTGGAGLGGSSFPGGPTGTPAAPTEDRSENDVRDLPDPEGRREAGNGTDPEAGPRGDETESPGAGEAGERAALERFLRNVRERQEQDAADQETGAVPPDGSAGEREPSGEPPRAAQPRSEQRRTGESGAGDETVPGEDSANQGSEEQINPFSEAAEEDEGQEEPAASGPEPEQEQAEENGDQANGGEEDAAAPEREGEGETTATPDDPGQPGGVGDEGADGDEVLGEGAGAQPSPDQPTGEGRQQGGELLFLEGDSRPGPAAGGGTVQLPGDDEVELPEGVAREAYRRDVERAISEGRIPLEYQEIIRNYFR